MMMTATPCGGSNSPQRQPFEQLTTLLVEALPRIDSKFSLDRDDYIG